MDAVDDTEEMEEDMPDSGEEGSSSLVFSLSLPLPLPFLARAPVHLFRSKADECRWPEHVAKTLPKGCNTDEETASSSFVSTGEFEHRIDWN